MADRGRHQVAESERRHRAWVRGLDPERRQQAVDRLALDVAARRAQLAEMEHVSASPPRLLGWLSVAAGAKIETLGYDPDSERVAVSVVLAELDRLGWDVDDRQTAGVGYDLLARHRRTREQRLVEVKGQLDELGPVTLEQHEWAQAQQRGEEYWLYVVTHCSGRPRVELRLQNPAGVLAGPRAIQRFTIPVVPASTLPGGSVSDADQPRVIDVWFPCAGVDAACHLPIGSGKNEKAIAVWFASRPIAQARAAVATALLDDDPSARQLIDAAVRGNTGAIAQLGEMVGARYPAGRPVVIDVFSGRGIIPLEAARLGARAVGIDLSPVATLAGRVLADYALRDWTAEPALPWSGPVVDGWDPAQPRLIRDLRVFLEKVGERTKDIAAAWYPANPDGSYPWGYLWAVSIPCDGCGRRFPLDRIARAAPPPCGHARPGAVAPPGCRRRRLARRDRGRPPGPGPHLLVGRPR